MADKPPKRVTTLKDSLLIARSSSFGITIVDANGAGRQLALQLVALGAPKLTVFDTKLVDGRDVAMQGYRDDDIGKPKVDVVGDLCHQANPRLDFAGVRGRLSARNELGNILFCCGGSLAERRRIWNIVADNCVFYADVRVEGDRARVIAATDLLTRRRYTSLLKRSATHRRRLAAPLICTTAVAASLGVYQFTRFVRGLPLQHDMSFDLAKSRLHVAENTVE